MQRLLNFKLTILEKFTSMVEVQSGIISAIEIIQAAK